MFRRRGRDEENEEKKYVIVLPFVIILTLSTMLDSKSLLRWKPIDERSFNVSIAEPLLAPYGDPVYFDAYYILGKSLWKNITKGSNNDFDALTIKHFDDTAVAPSDPHRPSEKVDFFPHRNVKVIFEEEEEKSEVEKSEDENSEVEKSEDENSEVEKSEDENSEVEKSEDENSEDEGDDRSEKDEVEEDGRNFDFMEELRALKERLNAN